MHLGAKINETGLILREGETLVFRRDLGGRFVLDARRTEVIAVNQPVRIFGTYAGPYLIDVDRIELA